MKLRTHFSITAPLSDGVEVLGVFPNLELAQQESERRDPSRRMLIITEWHGTKARHAWIRHNQEWTTFK